MEIIANPITVAREKLGWSAERLAVNAGKTKEQIEAIEAEEFTAEGEQLFILRIFAARKIEFETNDVGVTAVVGPCDDAALAKLVLDNRAVEVLKELKSLKPIGARLKTDVSSLGDLRKEDLVQLANCKFVAMYDDGDVTEPQPYFHIRLSKRGKALLAYLDKKPKSSLILLS